MPRPRSTCTAGESRSCTRAGTRFPPTCCHRRLFAAGTAADATAAPNACPAAGHRMKFASAVTHCEQWVEHRDASTVADDLIEQLQTQLCGQPPDLLIFFNASSPMAPLHGRDVARELRRRCTARWESSCPVVLGASWGSAGPGTGVIGGNSCNEIQESAALTVLAASLPSVRVIPFHADPEHDGLPTLIGGSWADLALLPESEAPHVLLLSDPSQLGLGQYSDKILKYCDNALPFSAKVGGLVPGGGLISLDCNGGETAVGTQGVAGVVLQGDIEVDTLVCQGAAPFGPVFEVTSCDGSTVFELDGEPAAQRVVEILEQSRRRASAQVAAAHNDETGSVDGEPERSSSDDDGSAAEQWAADGLPAHDGDPEWDAAPDDVLHLLAGLQVDGTPTRGEVTLLTTDQTAETSAPDSAKSSLPSIRISSDYVARHIVQADGASGGIQIDVSEEALQEGMRLQLHAFTRQSALDELSGKHSLLLVHICSDTSDNSTVKPKFPDHGLLLRLKQLM